MSEERPFPREKFNAIVSECIAILKKYGFTPVPAGNKDDTRFSDVFEDHCFGWFGDVSPKPELPVSPKRQSGLTQKKIDQITLECALVFIQQGVENVHYNESLNCIRATIADVLEAMGYENPELLCYHGPIWGCYKSWEEVARREGLHDLEIAESRKYWRENQPEYYEAA